MINVTLKDGSVKVLENAKLIIEFAKELSPSLAKKCVAAALDGKLVDLKASIDADCNLELILQDDPRAFDILNHSCAHLLAQAIRRECPLADRVKCRRIQIKHVPFITCAFPIDHRHMKFTRRDQNDIPTCQGVHTPLANVADVPFLKNNQFIVIVIVEVGRIRTAVIFGISVRIADPVAYKMISPICRFGIQLLLVLYIVRKQFHIITHLCIYHNLQYIHHKTKRFSFCDVIN